MMYLYEIIYYNVTQLLGSMNFIVKFNKPTFTVYE